MRLFVGLWPPPEVADVLDRITRTDHPGVRWTARQQWHVTLRFLGEVPDDEVPALVDALVATERCPAPVAVLGPATARLGLHNLVVPVAGVDDLSCAVRDATRAFGTPLEGQPFTGHLTLARGRGGRPVPLALATTEVAARWAVRDLAVVRSSLSPCGATYDTIATTALASDPTG